MQAHRLLPPHQPASEAEAALVDELVDPEEVTRLYALLLSAMTAGPEMGFDGPPMKFSSGKSPEQVALAGAQALAQASAGAERRMREGARAMAEWHRAHKLRQQLLLQTETAA